MKKQKFYICISAICLILLNSLHLKSHEAIDLNSLQKPAYKTIAGKKQMFRFSEIKLFEKTEINANRFPDLIDDKSVFLKIDINKQESLLKDKPDFIVIDIPF